MQYLADQRPGSGLCAAAGSLQRYRIMEWMSFIASDLHKGAFMPLFKKTTPADYRPLARQLVLSRLQWLDDHLADRDYLTGSTFTIADAHCYAIAMWTAYQDIDLSPWPNLAAYLARIGARPASWPPERPSVRRPSVRKPASGLRGTGMTARWTHRPEGSNWGDFGPDDQLRRDEPRRPRAGPERPGRSPQPA